MKKLFLPLAVAVAGFTLAQPSSDSGVNAKIRKEESERSQVMRILHMLTDRYGPRVTGTPGHEAAARWVVKQMTEWGFKNAHTEPWEFGHPGWSNERASGYIVSPVQQNLKLEVLAWTPSTNGTVTGSAMQLELPKGPEVQPDANSFTGFGGRGGRGPQFQQPTREELSRWLEANKGKIRGKMVMLTKAAVIPVSFEPAARRTSDEQLKVMYGPGGRGFGGRGNQPPDAKRLTANQAEAMIDEWLLANGALVQVKDAARAHGLIIAQQDHQYDPSKTIPSVIIRNEDYGRIERLLADGEDVKLEVQIVNHVYPEGRTSYNVVGELPGSDKADEIVMLGGHLDSWHSGTGATDNAIGSAIMLESARLIHSLGLQPRRTIRVALWSGEEEGLLGSIAYVKQHFGTFENPKPEFAKLDCYFNIDTGTGRPRGASVFGPAEAASVLRRALDPFADLGVAGANAISSRQTGGTDSTSFNNAGLPGIGFQQDTIEYNTETHHTNLDTYERIIPEDVKSAATVIASAVWHVTSLDAMMPRFDKEHMPAPVAPR